MEKPFYVLTFVFQVSVISNLVCAQVDPCLNNVLLSDLDSGHRNPNYTTGVNDANLCDYELDENQWYRIDSLVSNRLAQDCVTPSFCGTMWPIWMNGAHPTAANPGPVSVQVCSSDMSGNCCGTWSSNINVKYCDAAEGNYNFYVYQLKNVPFCDMAYCALGGYDRVLTRYPVMSSAPLFNGPITEIVNRDDCPGKPFNDFFFECVVQFTPQSADDLENARFLVSLLFDDKPDTNNPATNQTTNATALTVVFRSIAIRGNVGKSVSCIVKSYYVGQNIQSSAVRSTRSYWVGVKFSSPAYNEARRRIELKTDQRLNIEFWPTVPLGSCADITFQYDYNGIRVSTCQLFFKDSKMTQTVAANVAHEPGCRSFSSVLGFQPFNKPLTYASIWDNYTISSVTIFVECTPSLVPVCTSIYDPLVTTPDGCQFITYTSPGDFVFYRSYFGNRLFEVHVRHFECISPEVTCNCAIAVREGNDILIINACDISTPVTSIRALRDPQTPDGMARIVTTAPNYDYTITMPSGAYARVTIVYNSGYKTGRRMDIGLYPLREDRNFLTSGLCGNVNGNSVDEHAEFTPQAVSCTDGSIPYCTDGCNKYRLADTQSYINGHIYFPQCVSSSLVATICRCEKNLTANYLDCSNNSTAAHVRIASTFGTTKCMSARKKREEAKSEPMDDYVVTPDDFPVPDWSVYNTSDTVNPPTWPTASGITEAQAADRCQSLLESFPAYTTCSQYVDTVSIRQSCQLNVLLTDSLDAGSAGTTNLLKEGCEFGIESTLNTSSSDPTVQPDAVERILRNVKSNDCPGSSTLCNGRGRCVDAKCICGAGFSGIDCSIPTDSVPELTGFRRGCKCDARLYSCTSAFIFATNFYDSDNLTCTVIPSDANLATAYSSRAIAVSGGEVECELPPSPASESATATVYVLNISLSNDRIHYSKELQLTVYDSKCMNCNCGGDCGLKTETCMKGGKCFVAGEVNYSQNCEPTKTEGITKSTVAEGTTGLNTIGGFTASSTGVAGGTSGKTTVRPTTAQVTTARRTTTTTTKRPAAVVVPKKPSDKKKKNKKNSKKKTNKGRQS